ncbi:uncharacterized protein LOC120839732 [Ixodes scapularis]|uniref:uncharacterized protein LOC120839732 n=1 Tax=Ixodes scapularis TaxID=6945 RepID=UPI001A9F7040|nr:uncharacterized protein LOC120839732 [Ixodes scapularis]
MPLMHRRGPGDHGIDELAFALSKVAAEHYGQARSHRTGWLTGVVLYSPRHCVWLNRPSRGSLHDLYEASLAIVSNRPDSWAKPFKTALLGPVLFGGSDLAIFPSRGFLLYLNKLSYFFLMVVHTFCHTSQKQCGESMPQITVKRAGRVNSEKVYGKKIDIPHYFFLDTLSVLSTQYFCLSWHRLLTIHACKERLSARRVTKSVFCLHLITETRFIDFTKCILT